MGIVTNTKITHATPAAGYAHAASRLWEGDVHMHGVQGGCKDIAHQLIYNNSNIQVRVCSYIETKKYNSPTRALLIKVKIFSDKRNNSYWNKAVLSPARNLKIFVIFCK